MPLKSRWKSVTKFTIKQQLKSSYFWSVLLLPLVLIVTALLTIFSGQPSLSYLKESQINQLIITMFSVIVMTISIGYLSLMIRIFIVDNESKVNEMLSAMSSSKDQFIGKVMAIIFLVIGELIIYIGLFLSEATDTNWIGKSLTKLIQGIPVSTILISLLSIFLSIVFILIIAAVIGVEIKDEGKVQQASFFLFLGSVVLVSLVTFINLSDFGYRLIPVLGPGLLLKDWLLQQGFSICNLLAVAIQCLEILAMFILGIKRYQLNIAKK